MNSIEDIFEWDGNENEVFPIYKCKICGYETKKGFIDYTALDYIKMLDHVIVKHILEALQEKGK